MANPKGPNPIKVAGDVAELTLTDRNGNPKAICLIDLEDVPKVIASGRWSLGGIAGKQDARRTAVICGKKSCISLSRFIMNAPVDLLVDHKNGNRLDNRKTNLRFTDYKGNAQNRKSSDFDNKTGIRGVHWNSRLQKYIAQITLNGTRTYLGCFNSLEEAEKVASTARKQHYPDSLRDHDF